MDYLTNLIDLELANNQLSGTIPISLGNLTNLILLNLGYNQITGTIPTSLGNLTNLWGLRLNNNQLSGEIPTIITKLVNIEDTTQTYPGGLRLGYSYLTSTDNAVRAYLALKDPDWESTQNICKTLTLTANPTAGGIPTASPTKSSGCSAAGQYIAGETITLSPGTKIGYTFSRWTGATVSGNILTMPSSGVTVTANYIVSVCYLLTKVASPAIGGTITASPTKSSGCAVGKYYTGQVITFIVTPKLYYHFDRWLGGVNATTNKLIMPAKNTAITAYFGTNLRIGTYNDTYAGITHTSAWLTQIGASYYGITQHYTKTKASTITIYYTGKILKMYYTGGRTYGKVTIQIDTRTPVVLNEYFATTGYKKLWTSPTLTNGNHKAVITYYAGNPTNTLVNFDGVVIQ